MSVIEKVLGHLDQLATKVLGIERELGKIEIFTSNERNNRDEFERRIERHVERLEARFDNRVSEAEERLQKRIERAIERADGAVSISQEVRAEMRGYLSQALGRTIEAGDGRSDATQVALDSPKSK